MTTSDDLRARVRAQYGEGIPERSFRGDGRTVTPRRVTTPATPTVTALDLPWPLRLTIPWSALVSDNAKARAARRGDSATIVLTPAYREARNRIAQLAQQLMAGRPPVAIPLAFTARVWVPNKQRRDVVNFGKALHDALTGTVYEDDAWLYDVRWIRAGIDIDAPRAEVTIAPLNPDSV